MKRLLLKTTLLLCALIVGSSSLWADDVVLTLDCATPAATGTTSTALNATTIATFLNSAAGLSTAENKITCSNKTGDVYSGKGSGGGNIPQQCLKVGKASGGGGFTFTIPDNYNNVDVIEITCYGWKTSSSIKINNGTAQTFTTAQTETTKTFNLASGTKTFTIDVTSSAVCITEIVLKKKVVTSVADPTFSPAGGNYTSAQSVTLSCATTDATIRYTIDGNDPTSSSTEYTTAIPVTSTTTIKAKAFKGTDASNIASATYTILPVTHAGTSADPYTVTDARNALTAGIINAENDYYVRGYITKKNDIKDGAITYWISDDGAMTNTIQCYHGKYIDGADFTESTEFEVGDIATVKGKLLIYQEATYEFAEGNEVVSIESRTKVNIATFTATTIDLAIGETTATTVTNDQAGWTPVAYTYTSDKENIATVDENGVITAVAKGTANITVTPVVAELDPTYKVGDSKSIEITVHKPSHTASFSVNGVVSSTDYEEDDDIVFPANPDVLGGRTFVGWAAATIDGTTATAPSFVTSATMGTEDVTYYAVFANSVQADGWQKLEPSQISEEGTYAILTPDGYAFNGTISGGHGQATTDAFAFVNGTATTAPTGTCEITLVAVEGGYKMYNEDLGYLYATKAGTGGLSWHDTEDYHWSYSNANWEYSKSYSGSKARLRCYNNTFRTYSSNSNDEISFAKKTKVTTYSDYCTTITDESITITTTIGLGTLVSDFALDFTNVTGLEAYIAKENGGKIVLEKINKVPAGTGILLRSTNDGADYTVPKATSTDDVTGNLFVRGTGATVESDPAAGGHNYILSKKGDVYGFYHANGNKVAKNRAYLHTDVAAARIDLNFDNATGINEVKSEKTVEGIFDLQGRKVVTPSKGLYIVNGKKVVIK